MTTYKPSTDRPLWLHLESRWESVIRIARSKHAGLYRACLARGWERDDLNQELLLGVLAKQGEGSTYEPTKAGIAKYLVVATGGILRHLLERAMTLKATMITPGMLGPPSEDGGRAIVDASTVAEGSVLPALRVPRGWESPEEPKAPRRARRKR